VNYIPRFSFLGKMLWYHFLFVLIMKYTIIIFAISLLIACTDNRQLTETSETSGSSNTSNDPKTAISVDDKKPGSEENGCYMKITGRDTAIVVLEQKGTEVTGKMLYDNFEKDGSNGTLKGIQDGDIVKLFYDFNSEGMRSVMEVYFKKVPGGLIRGVGDMNMKGDTTYFTTGINYSDKEAFSKIDCAVVKEKMKW